MSTSIEQNWKRVKKKLKYKYPSLTDDDLLTAEVSEEKFIHRLCEKLGKTKREIRQELQQLVDPYEHERSYPFFILGLRNSF